ncbi:hypothetical protein BC830DRAFT_872298 [Chytriomyces sp. MP71]|nr:hypothetical protein BC830DRAFT_872298 [Chytriomyces sp. MP71]
MTYCKFKETPKKGRQTSRVIWAMRSFISVACVVTFATLAAEAAITRISSQSELDAFKRNSGVLGFFASEKDPLKKEIELAAAEYSHLPFAWTSIQPEDGLEPPLALLFTTDPESDQTEQNIFLDETGSTSFNAASLLRWITITSLPLINLIADEQDYNAFADLHLPLAITIFNTPIQSAKIQPGLKSLAKLYRGFLNFCVLDAEALPSLARRLNPSGEPYPHFVVNDADLHPLLDASLQDLTDSTEGSLLYNFLDEYFTQMLERLDNVDSANGKDPDAFERAFDEEATNADPVLTVTTRTFDRIVLDASNDVFLLILKDEHDYQSTYSSTFSRLASRVGRHTRSLRLGRLLLDNSRIPRGVGLDDAKAPALILIKGSGSGSHNKYGVVFELGVGGRSFEEAALWAFLEDNSNFTKELKGEESGDDEEGDEHDEL